MTQSFTQPNKDKTVKCARCGNVHQYFSRIYTAPDSAGLRYSTCPAGCGGLAFDEVKPAKEISNDQ